MIWGWARMRRVRRGEGHWQLCFQSNQLAQKWDATKVAGPFVRMNDVAKLMVEGDHLYVESKRAEAYTFCQGPTAQHI
jgi:hypothetical protein